MGVAAVMLFGAAFMRPLLRTISFVFLGAGLIFSYHTIINVNLAAQGGLYVLGACCFIR